MDRIASVCVDRDSVTPLRISHRRVGGSSGSALLFVSDMPAVSWCVTVSHCPRRFDEFEDIPVSGRRTSARWQDSHAHLLVTFDYCLFSSDCKGFDCYDTWTSH